jgi:fructokinase
MIVVAGEALIDLMPRAADARAAEAPAAVAGAAEAGAAEAGAGEQWFDARPGGAPCNVAVGLARLGRRTCFLGRVGGDPFGRLLRHHLQQAGVDTSLVVAASQKTTLAVTALDGQGKAEYSFYANGTADWQWTDDEVPQVLPTETCALYMGGLALRLAPGATVLEGLMRRTRRHGRALVFFDPNVRTGFGFSAAVERARVERQLAYAHVIKASEDDIALLYPGRDYREIAAAWQGMTSGLVAVTLGPGGVYALAPDGSEIVVPAAPAEVVDTVGAGDAFAAAMLDRLAGESPSGLDAASRLREVSAGALRSLLGRASVSAALTCEQAGAQSPGARTLDAAMADGQRLVRSDQHREAGLEPA